MKHGCILILFALSHLASGQTLGIIGGPDISNVKYSYQNENIKTLPQMGFHLVMAIEYKLSENLAFGTGIIFTEKGFREDYEIPDYDKTTFFYLDVPAKLTYMIHANKVKFYAHAGGYFALGLFTNLTGSGFVIEDGFGEQHAQYRKYDAGLLFGGKVAFDIWRYGISYSHGLLDIRNASEINIKNTVLGIDVAYMFK